MFSQLDFITGIGCTLNDQIKKRILIRLPKFNLQAIEPHKDCNGPECSPLVAINKYVSNGNKCTVTTGDIE